MKSVATIAIAVILSIFGTTTMGYIAMATPIGPWIETTLVLCSMLLFQFFKSKLSESQYTKSLGLTTAAGGIGGILATALGFSFPTLYFTAPDIFRAWMTDPLYFAGVITGLSFCAGSIGMLVAYFSSNALINQQQLPFPIGELIYKMISAKDQAKNVISLAIGFICTQLFLYLQTCQQFISQSIILLNKINFKYFAIPKVVIPMDLLPTFLAIGFITGHVIAVPLILGLIIKIFCLEPIYYFYPKLADLFLNIFPNLGINKNINFDDFSLAFCSGIVLYGALYSLIEVPKLISYLKSKLKSLGNLKSGDNKFNLNISNLVEIILILSFNILFLSYFKFSFISQIYLIFFAFVCTYQLLIIAGKLGVAPLGRFATFIMVPGMLIFGFDMIQTTIVATFIEISGGVGCDALFGKKMAQLSDISDSKIKLFQWLGLIVSSISAGFIFWLFINNFGLGLESGALPVGRAASRALLINVKSFDFFVLFFGVIFGYLLKFTKVNPMLILGGILMPPNYSLLLICGGLLTYLIKNKEEYYPFWSGVFASNSLWMLIKALL